MKSNLFVALFLILFLQLSWGFEESRHLRKNAKKEPCEGCWSLIKKLKAEPVPNITSFVIDHLNESTKNYNFLANLSTSGTSNYQVLLGAQQVVAGMNYRLIIQASNEGNCYGAFAVQVYDQFGDFSVTAWGNEVLCSDAKQLKKKGKTSNDLEEFYMNEEPPMPGGWYAISNLEDVWYVASFAVGNIATSNVEYSFVDDKRFKRSKYTFVVIKGEQQTVAGYNFHLLVSLEAKKKSMCFGAFVVDVFESIDGLLSVSEWGQEVTCEEAPGFPIDDH